MNPVTVDIKDLLVEKSIGEWGTIKESVWGIFIGKEPDNPTNTITLYDTPGVVGKQFDNKRHFFHSAFQIRVRSIDYLDSYAKAQACIKALDRYGKFQVEPNTSYDNIIMEDEPLALPEDSQGRTIFVTNGIAYRREIA